MKSIIILVLFIVLAFIAQLMLPWWSLSVVAFLMGMFGGLKPASALLTGVLGGLLLWGGYSFYLNLANDSLLANKVGQVLGGLSGNGMVLATAVLGAVLAGLSMWSGALGAKLFVRERS